MTKYLYLTCALGLALGLSSCRQDEPETKQEQPKTEEPKPTTPTEEPPAQPDGQPTKPEATSPLVAKVWQTQAPAAAGAVRDQAVYDFRTDGSFNLSYTTSVSTARRIARSTGTRVTYRFIGTYRYTTTGVLTITNLYLGGGALDMSERESQSLLDSFRQALVGRSFRYGDRVGAPNLEATIPTEAELLKRFPALSFDFEPFDRPAEEEGVDTEQIDAQHPFIYFVYDRVLTAPEQRVRTELRLDFRNEVYEYYYYKPATEYSDWSFSHREEQEYTIKGSFEQTGDIIRLGATSSVSYGSRDKLKQADVVQGKTYRYNRHNEFERQSLTLFHTMRDELGIERSYDEATFDWVPPKYSLFHGTWNIEEFHTSGSQVNYAMPYTTRSFSFRPDGRYTYRLHRVTEEGIGKDRLEEWDNDDYTISGFYSYRNGVVKILSESEPVYADRFRDARASTPPMSRIPLVGYAYRIDQVKRTMTSSFFDYFGWPREQLQYELEGGRGLYKSTYYQTHGKYLRPHRLR